MSESLLHLVHDDPRGFLTQMLVRMLVQNVPVNNVLASNAARSLGIDCLVHAKDADRYPCRSTETARERILSAYLRHVMPVYAALAESEEEKKGAVFAAVDEKYWE